jgi:hypothetical protein
MRSNPTVAEECATSFGAALATAKNRASRIWSTRTARCTRLLGSVVPVGAATVVGEAAEAVADMAVSSGMSCKGCEGAVVSMALSRASMAFTQSDRRALPKSSLRDEESAAFSGLGRPPGGGCILKREMRHAYWK